MNDKNLRDRIVDSAYEMFTTRGVKSVTMDAISSELGISKRTLYEEFESKNELLRAVLFEMNGYYQGRNEQISAMNRGAVEKIFMITSLQNERNSKEKLFFQDIVSNYPQLMGQLIEANYDTNVARIRKNLEQGCVEGYFYSYLNLSLVMDFFMGQKIQNHFAKAIPKLDLMSNFALGTVFFLRSIATTKGVEEIDRLCKINNINIYK